MILQERINSELVVAMKAKDVTKRDLLRVVIGEMNRIGKELSDKDVVKILKKMIENATEVGNTSEISILETYLPKEISDNDIHKVVEYVLNSFLEKATELKNGNKSLTKFFIEECSKTATAMYNGQLDNKKIIQKINELLKDI